MRTFPVVSALLAAGMLAVVHSQQAPTFRARVDLVELDVAVLDDKRRPLRGLDKSAFTVLEDGKPQEIAVFEAINIPDPEPPPVAWMRDVAPDVVTNEVRPTRLWVVVVDDALIPGNDPWIIKSAKQIVQDIIARFGPEDLVSIVYTADSRQAQDFTNDRAKLLATLDKFHPGLANWRINQDKQDPQFWLGSVNTVLNVLDVYALVPHTRKSLIWVTPGAPIDMLLEGPAAPGQVQSSIEKRELPGGWTYDYFTQLRLRDLMKDLYALARKANIAVYPIDPCGLSGLKAYAMNYNLGVPDHSTMPWVRSMDHIMATASNTGGRAVVNTNDFTPGIDAIFEENASYYSIGYYSTNSAADGRFRRLEVKVNHPDASVRTRSGYTAPGPRTPPPPKSAGDRLNHAIAAPVPLRDLPLRAAVAPFAIPGSRNAAVTIALGVRQPIPEAAGKERTAVTTELRTTAYTTEGQNRGSQRHTARVTLRAGAQGDADYEALSRIDLPPGRYRLRLAAFHEITAKTGTVMVDVVVPDFSREPVSMSGVILNASPGRPSAPRDLFNNVLPLIPSAQRVFSKTERASALFYLYQSTTALVPAEVIVKFTDTRGAELITDNLKVPVENFATAENVSLRPPSSRTAAQAKSDPFLNKALRAAEVQYALPLGRLPAGEFLLTFDVKAGAASMRRDVRIEVR